MKKIIDKTKTSYYKDAFLRAEGDLKKTWNLIRGLTSVNNRKAIKQIVYNEQKFTSPETITEVFNTYFNNVAQKLDFNITSTDLNPLSYVPFNQNYFYLYPVPHHECVTVVEKQFTGIYIKTISLRPGPYYLSNY